MASEQTTRGPADDYRRLLRWYPARWRVAHGEALVGMLLEDHERRGGSVPDRAETRSLILGGLRERFVPYERAGTPTMIALASAAVFSLFYVFSVTWSPDTRPAGSIGPFSNPSVFTAGLLVLAWVAGMRDSAIAARRLARTAVVVALLTGVASHAFGWFGPSPDASAIFTVLATVAGFAPRSHRHRAGAA